MKFRRRICLQASVLIDIYLFTQKVCFTSESHRHIHPHLNHQRSHMYSDLMNYSMKDRFLRFLGKQNEQRLQNLLKMAKYRNLNLRNFGALSSPNAAVSPAASSSHILQSRSRYNRLLRLAISITRKYCRDLRKRIAPIILCKGAVCVNRRVVGIGG